MPKVTDKQFLEYLQLIGDMTEDSITPTGMVLVRDRYGTETLSEVMGVSVRTIENWCQGRRTVSKPSLMLLKIFLGES